MDPERLAEHKLRNDLQQASLLVVLGLMLGYLGWAAGGATFAWASLLAVAVLYLANPVASPRLVLGMYGARALAPRQVPRLYLILEALAARAGLKRVPRLYRVPTRVMTAFATGSRDDAAIAVSDELLRRLSLRELAGVLAHELSHVANGDIQVMAFADTVSRITAFLGLLGQVLLFASIPLLLLGVAEPPVGAILVLLAGPSAVALVQLALSRNREYEADRSAAELSGDPAGLASALAKLERWQGRFWEQLVLPGRRLPDPSLLRTHPPVEARIERLMELAPPPSPTHIAPLLYDETPGLGGELPRAPRWHAGGLWF